MSSSDKGYDLGGIHGAEVFRELPDGLRVELADGAVGKITGNPNDGAFLVLEIVADATRPDRVGIEEVVYFQDVRRVVADDRQDGAND